MFLPPTGLNMLRINCKRKLKMKPSLLLFMFAFLCSLVSCKKYHTQQYDQEPQSARNVRFVLYTDKDFSDDNSNITFKVFIQSSNISTIWDSTFAPMRVKDIPAFANKLVVEKNITANTNAILKVGFRYTIENVGESWHIDTSSAYQTFKEVNYNFQ